jgi:tetratricopeptide (TPR) repeat protein
MGEMMDANTAYAEIGDRIAGLRKSREMTQAALAGGYLTERDIIRLERRKGGISPHALQFIAEQLGCTPQFILRGYAEKRSTGFYKAYASGRQQRYFGDVSAALQSFKELLSRDVVELCPELHKAATLQYAECLQEDFQFDEASIYLRALLQRAIPEERCWAAAHASLIRCYTATGRPHAAIGSASRLLRSLLGAGRAWEHAGFVLGATEMLPAYTAQGDQNSASALARKLLGRVEEIHTPSIQHTVYSRIATTLAASGDIKTAVACAENANEIAVIHDFAHPYILANSHAELLLSFDNRAAAQSAHGILKTLMSARQLPVNVTTTRKILRIHADIKRGAPDAALANARDTLLPARQSPGLLGRAYAALGEALAQTGKHEDALAFLVMGANLLEGCGLRGESGPSWERAATIYGVSGNEPMAAKARERAVRLRGFDSQSRVDYEPLKHNSSAASPIRTINTLNGGGQSRL